MKNALLAAGLIALAGAAGAAVPRAVVDTYEAEFVDLGGGMIGLDGFGRGVSNQRVGANAFAPSASVQATPVRQTFFDTWNVDVSMIAPGPYSFQDMLVSTLEPGSVEFFTVTFNAYDAQGVRSVSLFEVAPDGKSATGSATFTVLESCPVQVCVWFDVVGTQLVDPDTGNVIGGYGGTTIAQAVPEPSAWALMALGLAGLGAWTRRRAPATAHAG